MAIQWRFWHKTGKTFFNRRIIFQIDAAALEFAVASKLNYRLDESIPWSQKRILEMVEHEIHSHGSPMNWYMNLDRIGFDEKEQQALFDRAREIVKEHFPEAYQIVKE